MANANYVDKPNRWNPKEVIGRMQEGNDPLQMKRALLIVRGEPEDNIAFFEDALRRGLGVEEFIATSIPRDLNYVTAAAFVSGSPSVILIEAPRVRRENGPGHFLDNLRDAMRNPLAFGTTLPIVSINRDWAYSYSDLTGAKETFFRGGLRFLEEETRASRAVALYTSRADRGREIFSALDSIRKGQLSSSLKIPE